MFLGSSRLVLGAIGSRFRKVRTEKRFVLSDFLGSSFRERETVLQEDQGLQGGKPSAMELINFAIDRFGGTGFGIERGDDDAETGLFPGRS